MKNSVDKCLCYKLHYLTRTLLVQLNDEIKSHGVTQGQLPVLCSLSDEEGQTQAELCEKVQVEQPTMANTLRRMERDGLISRTACELDKRQSRVFLTDQIRPMVETLQEKRDEVIARMTSQMSLEDLESFHRLLDLATQSLKEPHAKDVSHDQEKL